MVWSFRPPSLALLRETCHFLSGDRRGCDLGRHRPIFNFSDTWQLVINTGTTVVTFLMVFLIQNTQNRDSVAIQLKLAELIMAVKGAKNRLAAVEELSEEELKELQEGYRLKAQSPDGAQKKNGTTNA